MNDRENKNKALFEDMRRQLSPDESVMQSVLRRARRAEAKEGSNMDENNKNNSNRSAFVQSKWKYVAAAAACATLAVGASAMLLRNADKLTADESGAGVATSSLSAVQQPDSEVIDTGKCGDELTYKLYENGVLNITGTGRMYDFEYDKNTNTVNSPFIDKDIKSIVIADGVQSIGNMAFYELRSLTAIAIPGSVESIGEYAFMSCTGLTELSIPLGVKNIGLCAFSDCTALKSVTIPDSLTSIETSAFFNCRSLTGIDIPNGVKTIGDWAFTDCDELTSVTIPDSVTRIGRMAFSNCKKLSGVRIPGSVTYIGVTAFGYYSSEENTIKLDGFTITGTAGSEAERYAKDNSFTFVTEPGDAPPQEEKLPRSGKCGDNVTYTLDNDGVLSIMGTGKMYDYDHAFETGADYVSESPFYANMDITAVKIAEGVTSIGNDAFMNCTNIREVTIPESVMSIGDSAFFKCVSLESVIIPSNVTEISEYAFSYCTSLTSVILPENLITIGARAFADCEILEEITIPGRVSSIGDGAFERCKKLKSVTIQSGVGKIGNNAFYDCAKLIRVRIPSSVSYVGYKSFGYYTQNGSDSKVKDFTIEGVRHTKAQDYAEDNLFTFIDIISADPQETNNTLSGKCGANVTYTLNENGLLEISGTGIMYNYPTIPSPFAGNRDIKCVAISAGVTNIGAGMFRECTALTSVYVSGTVTDIGDAAFANCTALNNVKLPSGIQSIGNVAFQDCNALKSITIPGYPQIGDGAFGFYHTADSYKKNSDFKIMGTSGSPAEEYAKKNGFTFVKIGNSQ